MKKGASNNSNLKKIKKLYCRYVKCVSIANSVILGAPAILHQFIKSKEIRFLIKEILWDNLSRSGQSTFAKERTGNISKFRYVYKILRVDELSADDTNVYSDQMSSDPRIYTELCVEFTKNDEFKTTIRIEGPHGINILHEKTTICRLISGQRIFIDQFNKYEKIFFHGLLGDYIEQGRLILKDKGYFKFVCFILKELWGCYKFCNWLFNLILYILLIILSNG